MSIADKILALQTDSAAIADAIAAKGVTVPSGSGFDDYASLIGQISGGGGRIAVRVSYIESNGTQYVSTGYVPNANTRLILDAAMTQVEAVTMAGLYKSSNPIQRFNIGVYQSQWHFGVSNNNASNKWVNFTSPSTDTQRHTFEVRGNGYCAVDSTTKQITVDNTSSYANAIYLFARNNVGTVGAYSKIRLYEAIIKENDTIIHDFVPYRIGQTGFLYDTIGGDIYMNLGSGTFTIGSDV